jgi:hypothetical protein
LVPSFYLLKKFSSCKPRFSEDNSSDRPSFYFKRLTKRGIVMLFLDNYFVSNIPTMASIENLSSVEYGIQASCPLESVTLPSTISK